MVVALKADLLARWVAAVGLMAAWLHPIADAKALCLVWVSW